MSGAVVAVRGQERGSSAMDAEFTAFVLAARTGLRRFAYLLCGDWHRADDIVQIALSGVYRRWSRIEQRDGADAYVRRAVVNAAIDERRRPWRRERLEYKPVENSGERTRDLSSESIDNLPDRVLAALTNLPTRQRAVVVLRYIEDLDVDQTAALLRISPGTVKSQASRGLANLRACLTEPSNPKGPRGADE